jgi:EAL domain-containing protein (putative c-di-GMP-specific phosphodiesterase class I)
MRIAERILKHLHTPVIIDGESVSVNASIGIAMQDEFSQSAEDLLKKSDYAMYYAKKRGKNNIQVYKSEIHNEIVEANNLVFELKRAIEQQQLTYYFQPVYDLNTNDIVGFEALLRWQHPNKGVITPDSFIEIAEKNGLLKKMDNQLFEQAAIHLNKWKGLTNKNLYISINISAQRFMNSKLVNDLKKVIDAYKIKPGSIIIEITEHTLMENINIARLTFEKLKKLQVPISLDDFGTGYSSLSYLDQLPFDIIKIDRSFISHINQNKKEHPVINAVVALAKTMKLTIIAEGIENELQLKLIKSLGCKYGQGNFLCKPLDKKRTEKLIASPSSK